jgi:hypothetical protein
MPSLETMDRKQWAVLWNLTRYDAYGKPLVNKVPEEIRVRWDVKQREVLDKNGNTIATDVTVIVAQDIAIGSWMWLGRLVDIPGATGSVPTCDLFYVKTADKTGELKGRLNRVRRQLGLMRATDALPLDQ